jgi:hypothetical protein
LTLQKPQSQKEKWPRRGQEKSDEDRKNREEKDGNGLKGSARGKVFFHTRWFAARGFGVIKPSAGRPGRMGSKLRSRVRSWAFPLPHTSAYRQNHTQHTLRKNAAERQSPKICDKHNFLKNAFRARLVVWVC